MDEKAAFSAMMLGGTMFVTTEGEIVYRFSGTDRQTDDQHLVVLGEQLINGRQLETVRGITPSTTRVNFFHGKDPEQWTSGVKTYMDLSLGEVYDGIEVRLKAYGDNVEKLFYIAPGAQPEQIRLRVSGADSLGVNNQGQLVLTTEFGSVAFTRPVAWQDIEGDRVQVEATYEILASSGQYNEYTFGLGHYDHDRPLVIDPLLASTFIGGSGDDIGHSIGIDSLGYIYVTGETSSTDFPVDIYDTDYNGGVSDVFVSKFSANLTTLLASAYIGGADKDVGYSLAIDSSDNIYIAGTTASSDYPVANGYDLVFNNSTDLTDGFITRLSSDLSTIVASTFIGGSDDDEVWDLALLSGDVYLTGYTLSPNFPTTGSAFDASHGGYEDIFIAKFPATLSTLSASTFVGGTGYDFGRALTFDSLGNVLVTGSTTSPDFPSTTGFDTVFGGGAQVIVANLPADLSAINAASVFGSGGTTNIGHDIAVDSEDNIFITGESNSPDFPTTAGAIDRTSVSFEAFVTKFNSALDTISASTFLGGSSWDQGFSLTLDDSNNVYVTGHTNSDDFPTSPLAYDSIHNGWDDVFITKIQPDLTDIIVSTYIGSNGSDRGRSLVLDTAGNIYIAGYTNRNSDDYPFPTTAGAYDRNWQGGKDVFISQLDADLAGRSVQFKAASYSVSETEPLATITVTRSGNSAGAVSVAYATASGTASDTIDYTAVSGVLNWSDGDSADKSFTVPILDDDLVEIGETISLVLSSSTGIPLGSPETAILTIIDDESPGALQFSAPTFSVNENDTSTLITVSRTAGSDGTVTVDYATVDGTATDGIDYTEASGTLTWGSGDTTNKTFSILIADNNLIDGNRSLTLSLENPTGAALGALATADLTIYDDETPGSLQFSLESFPITEGVGTAVVTVTRMAGDDGAVSVEYFTLDDTATLANGDYTESTGTLYWGDGDSADKTFLVTIIDDDIIEGEEKITLTLHNQTGGATLGIYNVANINIVDNDTPVSPGTLGFNMSGYSISEEGSEATITVTRSGGTDQAVSVQYSTSNGTAKAGSDYTSTNGTLFWNDQDSADKTFTVAILDDGAEEGDETIQLTLSNATGGASLGTPNPVYLTIADDDFVEQNGTIQFNVPNYSAWENGGSFDVTVYRINGDTGVVTVDFATSDNTAVVGGDYDEMSGTLSWLDGEGDGKTFTVNILDDTEFEGDELVDLTLSSPTGGAVLGGQSTATLTILENDVSNQYGTVQFNSSSYHVSETDTQVIITVTRTDGSDGLITVYFATSDITGEIGGDYDEMSGSLEWGDGDSTDKTFVVYILDDDEGEGDETVGLTLSNPTGGAVLGNPASAVLTIQDNENSHCLTPNDEDPDDDGIPDDEEDLNDNGVTDAGETSPCYTDSDNDGIQDGTELGRTLINVSTDTNLTIFQPDLDPATTTNPEIPDTDGDGISDGDEDVNKNGRWDIGETEPTVASGNYDLDTTVGLSDLIQVLKTLASQTIIGQFDVKADTNGNHRVDLPDGLFIFKQLDSQ